MSGDNDPLKAKSRLPFGPTIRPSLVGAQGAGVWLYIIVAAGMAGFALYWMQANKAPVTDPRVMLLFAAAIWFSIRAAMRFATQRSASSDAREEKNDSQEGKDS